MKTVAVLFASALAMVAYTVNARSTANLPEGWSVGGEAAKLYSADVDSADTPSGEGSVVLRRSETGHPFGAAHLVRAYPGAAYAGKRVRVSMRARYEGEGANLGGRIFIGSDDGAHVTGRGVNSDWHLYQTTVTWPADVKKVSVGVALTGTGSAKVDSIEFEVLGDAPAGQKGFSMADLVIDPQGADKARR
jgi:hypothetical protein